MNHSSTRDLASALKILAQQIHSEDGAANVVCAEAADRILLLVTLTNELTAHILASPIHHPKCTAKTKGSYCNCILSRVTPS